MGALLFYLGGGALAWLLFALSVRRVWVVSRLADEDLLRQLRPASTSRPEVPAPVRSIASWATGRVVTGVIHVIAATLVAIPVAGSLSAWIGDEWAVAVSLLIFDVLIIVPFAGWLLAIFWRVRVLESRAALIATRGNQHSSTDH